MSHLANSQTTSASRQPPNGDSQGLVTYADVSSGIAQPRLQANRQAWTNLLDSLSETDVNREAEPLYSIYGQEDQDIQSLVEWMLGQGPEFTGKFYSALREGIRTRAQQGSGQVARPRQPVSQQRVNPQDVAPKIATGQPRKLAFGRSADDLQKVRDLEVLKTAALKRLQLYDSRKGYKVVDEKKDDLHVYVVKDKDDHVIARGTDPERDKLFDAFEEAKVNLSSLKSVVNHRVRRFQASRVKAKAAKVAEKKEPPKK